MCFLLFTREGGEDASLFSGGREDVGGGGGCLAKGLALVVRGSDASLLTFK